jgi:uncharacterized protein
MPGHALESLIIVAAGLMSGLINAIAGGGSLVLFPALLAAGLPVLPANVTNAVANWPGYAGSACGFIEDIRRQPRRTLTVLSLATGLGSAAGSVLLLETPASAFDRVVPALVLSASLLLACQEKVRKLVKATGQDPGGVSAGHSRYRAAGTAMGAAGIYGGYFGGALGVVMLAVLSLTTSGGLKRLNAVKTVLCLVSSTVSVPVFAAFGPVRWAVAALAAPSVLVGGYLGARLARRMNQHLLRWCIVLLGIAMAIYLLAEG